MSDRIIALKRELREARAWMTDAQLAEVVLRCAAIDEIDPFDLRGVLASYRPECDTRRRFAVVDVDERHARALRICELWGFGLAEVEIAGLVDMSPGGFKTEKQKLRGQGYELPPRGTGGSNAKLTIAEAIAIRAGREAGRSVVDLAAVYGVSESTVRDVLRGSSYGQVAA